MGLFKRLMTKKYMSWENYTKLVSNIEHIRFIDQTAEQSINNHFRLGK